MTVSEEVWRTYIKRLGKMNETAAAAARAWIEKHGLDDIEALTDYAFGLATKYGEGAAALAAEMYDAMAVAEGVSLAPAIPAATATRREVAFALRKALQHSQNTDLIGSTVGRMAKQAGMDTAMQNAVRDRAEWAWVAVGDTCAFCVMLASNGWQPASKGVLNGGHASHVHANCDCMFAIRHRGDTKFAAYDERKYENMYKNAPLDHWNTPDGKPPAGHESAEDPRSKNRINAIRRMQYAENRDEINAQKRVAYATRQEAENE